MRWMNLEPVRQSEVSQKEKSKYCILTHVYAIRKTALMSLLQGSSGHMQRTDVGLGGRGGRRNGGTDE